MQLRFLLATLLVVICAEVQAATDLIITHARVLTQDRDRPQADAIAIGDGKLLAVGTESDVLRLRGPTTRVEDAAGAVIMPGLIDTHSHPVIGAEQTEDCSLEDKALDLNAIAVIVQGCIAQAKPADSSDWMVAINLNPSGFEADHSTLDRVLAERPLVLLGTDGHTAWVNTRGLALSGITATTPDPVEGRIIRRADGSPTGHLIDAAQEPVLALLPRKSLATRVKATTLALQGMRAAGITAVMDASVREAELEVYAELARKGELMPRVAVALLSRPNQAEASLREMIGWRARFSGLSRLSIDTVKIFADGVLEYPTQSAALLAPYLDQDGKPTEHSGHVYIAPPAYAAFVSAVAAQGFNVHVHAIGDRAVRESLDAFALARANPKLDDPRFSISHLQLIHPDDWARFGALKVFASFQLLWAQPNDYSIEAVAPHIGAQRMRYMYPARGVHDAGGIVVGGSDWNVSSFNPFEAMAVGHSRRNPDQPERGALVAEQSLPTDVLLRAYTIDAARMLGMQDEIGSLTAGKTADLIMIDRDPLQPDVDLATTRVLATMIGGHWVYRARAAMD